MSDRVRRAREQISAAAQSGGELVKDKAAALLGSEADGQPDWVGQLLDHVVLPESPVTQPWAFDFRTLIAAQLPRRLRNVPRLLDRLDLGAVRLSPDAIAIDADDNVPWADVVEIQAAPLVEVMTVATVGLVRDAVAGQVGGLARRPARWVSARVSDVLLSLYLIGLRERQDGAGNVPTEIIHRGRLGRHETMQPGPLSSAVLALPGVSASIFATAEANGVAVTYAPMRADASRHAELARAHVGALTAKLTELRQVTAGEPDDDPDSDDDPAVTDPQGV